MEQDKSAALQLLNGFIGNATAPPSVEAGQGVATIEVTQPDGTTQSTGQKVGDVKYFEPPGPCRIKIAAGLRLQLVKFELSAEIHVGIEIPCAYEEINEVAQFAQNWVDERLQHEQALLEESRKQLNAPA
jgi:hypothetical protein